MRLPRRAMTRFDEELPEMAMTDPFGPPERAVRVRCAHCEHEFSSDEMVWYRGLWGCPKISCGGSGFLFDIYPTASVFWKEDGDEVEVDEWGVMMVPCGGEEAEEEEWGFPAPGL